ncbi:MAG: GAF domain-containing protein, partial [Thermoleophilaceae bacterium]
MPHSHEGDAERLSRIVETQRDIVAAAGDLDTVTRIVLESSCALTGADGAMLSFVEGPDLVTHAAIGIAERGKRRRPLESSVARHAIRSGRPLLIEDCDNDDRLDRVMQRAIGDKSLICVPLFQGAHVVGALNVMSSPAGSKLSEDDR